MSVLSDLSLKVIYPESDPGPCSIDLHLGDVIRKWPRNVPRDPRIDQSHEWQTLGQRWHELGSAPVWVLEPGVRYLAETAERVHIRPDCCGQIAARSSWGRDGLSVIIGPAGYLDAGFEGTVTLELSVIGSELFVWPGAAVAQLIVHRLTSVAARPYGHPDRQSKYQGQSAPTPSRMHAEVNP